MCSINLVLHWHFPSFRPCPSLQLCPSCPKRLPVGKKSLHKKIILIHSIILCMILMPSKAAACRPGLTSPARPGPARSSGGLESSSTPPPSTGSTVSQIPPSLCPTLHAGTSPTSSVLEITRVHTWKHCTGHVYQHCSCAALLRVG